MSFIIGEPLLTFNISTESKEINYFESKDVILLPQGNVFEADGIPLKISL